jgi:hypothetical protein
LAAGLELMVLRRCRARLRAAAQRLVLFELPSLAIRAILVALALLASEAVVGVVLARQALAAAARPEGMAATEGIQPPRRLN